MKFTIGDYWRSAGFTLHNGAKANHFQIPTCLIPTRPLRLHTLILLLLGICFLWVTNCNAGLYGSVRKYSGSSINSESISKLRKYDHLIKYFCNFSYFVPNHKVSPDFIRALILAESSVNPNAVSSKGARGLGQIIPSTGRETARALWKTSTHFRYIDKRKLENLNQNDLFDPAINILLTCFLIAKYNYKFEGKIHLVVSAWNAGENTDALATGRHAPYPETEDLIGKVNAYYMDLLNRKIFH